MCFGRASGVAHQRALSTPSLGDACTFTWKEHSPATAQRHAVRARPTEADMPPPHPHPQATSPSVIYEQRTYQLHPGYGSVPKLLEAFRKGLPDKVRWGRGGVRGGEAWKRRQWETVVEFLELSVVVTPGQTELSKYEGTLWKGLPCKVHWEGGTEAPFRPVMLALCDPLCWLPLALHRWRQTPRVSWCSLATRMWACSTTWWSCGGTRLPRHASGVGKVWQGMCTMLIRCLGCFVNKAVSLSQPLSAPNQHVLRPCMCRARQASRTVPTWRDTIGTVTPGVQHFTSAFLKPVSISAWK